MLARLMGLKIISPDALHRLAQNREPVTVVGFNSRQSWTKARVPGAKNLDSATYDESDLPTDKRAPFWCSIVLAPCAGKLPTPLVEPRSSATATFRSCRRELVAGSRRASP